MIIGGDGRRKKDEITIDEIVDMIGVYEAYNTLNLVDKDGVSVAEKYWKEQTGLKRKIMDMYIDQKFSAVMQILAPIYNKNKPEAKA